MAGRDSGLLVAGTGHSTAGTVSDPSVSVARSAGSAAGQLHVDRSVGSAAMHAVDSQEAASAVAAASVEVASEAGVAVSTAVAVGTAAEGVGKLRR